MDQISRPTDPRADVVPRIDEAARRIAALPRVEDAPEAGLAVLREAGLLDVAARETAEGYRYDPPWRTVLRLLARIGGADLSLGRLLEGHLNALQLVALYGSEAQKRHVLASVRAGTLLGVWGADTEPRFAVSGADSGELRLSGAKRYASGLGLVGLALVPYEDEARVSHLLLLPVDDPERQDGAPWRMGGMRGSRSGTFRFEGLTIDESAARVGAPGDYRREPFFVGGIWRCAAAQLGAVERLVEILAAELTASERLQHPLQSARVGEAIMAARDARLNVEAAAEAVETASVDAELAVSFAALARLRVEKAALDVIELVQRGLGLPAFHEDHAAERIMRDLAVYLRQANPDALLLDQARRLSRRLPDLLG
ncbi:acyl-CoA dehydrogenase family protein [Aureimonas sp. AU4]|uniref:acyl-CoA dehydrogenase family protein n=1 Tax=Aureimonas sp. AU4 TaxID=1638163 RepID=UPI000786064F|nr:acyl-CoA dehydrogenase family protein [Aureimonas sp. AU4]